MPRPATSSRRGRFPLFVLALALLTSLTGCGLLGGDDEAPSTNTSGGLEKPRLKLSIMTPTDLAPLHHALDKGYFKEAGFDIERERDVVVAQNGGESVAKLLAGEVDIAYSSWVPFLVAKANSNADIMFVNDASSAGPKSTMVVAMPNSSVKTIQDMAGKRVAVTATSTMSDLLVKSALKTAGVDYNSVQWVPTPFPATPKALTDGQVDAAFATEPFIQLCMKAGATPIFDTAEGPTANLGTAGYGASSKFVRENPKTLAAFQSVMERATTELKQNRDLVEPMLVKYSKIDEQTAKLATLLDFQSKLDATRLQRVADLMLEFNVIDKKIDVAPMIARPATTG